VLSNPSEVFLKEKLIKSFFLSILLKNLQQKQQLDAVCAELAIWKKTSEKLRVRRCFYNFFLVIKLFLQQKMELLEEENSFLARSSAEKQQKLNFELQNSQQEISRFKQLHKVFLYFFIIN
jgi:hypothetical protein